MKRKRKTVPPTAGVAAKKAKIDHDVTSPATNPLLQQFYTQVLTLRQYLVVRLSKDSKKRRRKVLQYGVRQNECSGDLAEQAVVRLLDTTLVGVLTGVSGTDVGTVDKDISVFTQQLCESTTTISPTQGSLKQSEVGLLPLESPDARHHPENRPRCSHF